jgi:hypothetical protein
MLPSVAEQISAVLKAPILFAIALFFFWLAIWKLLEWRYRAVNDKTKELFELSRIEVNYWKNALARSTTKIAEQVESLKNEKNLPAQVRPTLDQLTHTTSQVNLELAELGKANSAATVSTGWVGLWRPPYRATQESVPDGVPQPPPDIPRRFMEGR